MLTTLQDDLWGSAVFLKEANSISIELKKKVSVCRIPCRSSQISQVTFHEPMSAARAVQSRQCSQETNVIAQRGGGSL